MQHTNCLNCSTELSGKFCSGCGQKADTHRINAQHFFTHDLLHGVMHLEKGILFTIKETFVRPGYAAMDYIKGKRIRYYNIFYLILLVIGFFIIASGLSLSEAELNNELAEAPEKVVPVLKFLRNNIKFLLVLLIPLYALSGFIIFSKLNLNYSEHLIISGFIMLGTFILLLISALLANVSSSLSFFFSCIAFLFFIRVYYQATSHVYKLYDFAWRIIVFYFFTFILFVVIVAPIITMLLGFL